MNIGFIVIGLAVVYLIYMLFETYQQMKKHSEAYKKIDKSKLKDYDDEYDKKEDEW